MAERMKKREIAEYLSSSRIKRAKHQSLKGRYFLFIKSINENLVNEFLQLDTLALFDLFLEHNRLIYHNEFELNIKQYLRNDISFIKGNIVLMNERYKKIYEKMAFGVFSGRPPLRFR